MWCSEVRQEAKEAQVVAEQFWATTVTQKTVRRFWSSISQPKQRTMICVLLWTARKELHAGEFKQ